jgi:FkbM family methyltransferase
MQLIFNFFLKFYLLIFARQSFQKFNLLLYKLTIRSLGYNNFVNDLVSGELHFIKLLKRYDPKLCIDIGANIGSYSSTLLEHTNAVVIAFEPLPRAYDALGKLKTTYPERFIPINQGVGAEVGHLDLHFGSEVSVMASFSQEINEIDYVSRNNTNSISVEVNTLDNFFKDFDPKFSEIDLIKIDTEGFEHEVLVGAANTLVKYRPKFIQIEFNHHQLFRSQSIYSFSKILKNYKVFQILPYNHGLVIRDPKLAEANIFQFSNFVFIRQDISLGPLSS